MRITRPIFTCTLSALWLCSPHAMAQTAATTEVFDAASAILDTSIPFAIGAREAQQDLRSAYGWPTFQEGLVDGVYFRIDPDGYARFAPTPRLDTDVFEVICRPGTLSCMGRKDRFSVYLGSSGLLELKIENVAPGDTFHVTDGIAETPLPDRILMPLDAPLETLLSYGGELIVRRGTEEKSRVSLKGFGAVIAYLRWVAARQDYSVLPRGWPVPNSAPAVAQSGLTNPDAWPAPANPGLNPGFAQPALAPLPQILPAAPVQAQVPAPAQVDSAALGDIRTELNTLQALLAQRNYAEQPQAQAQAQALAPLPPQQPATQPAYPVAPSVQAGMAPNETEYSSLVARVQRLEQLIEGSTMQQQPEQPPQMPGAIDKLSYLVNTLGFDLETATLILKNEGSAKGSQVVTDVLATPPLDQPASPQAAIYPAAPQAPIDSAPPQTAIYPASPQAPIYPVDQGGAEFFTLSDYLKSILP
jgi:hypothetical protein